MSTEHIPAWMRKETIRRSNGLCEYCHLPNIAFFPHEVDHVIARKHGGKLKRITWPMPALNVTATKGVILLRLTLKQA